MAITEVFAGIPIRDYAAAVVWYERLMGRPPDMVPNDNEAAWQLTDTGWIYLVGDPDRSGNGLLTVLVDDLETHVAGVESRGLAIGAIETVSGVVKTAAACLLIALATCGLGAAPTPAAAASAADVSCSRGGTGTTRVSPVHDVVLGPLVLLGGRRWAETRPNGFNGHGYKIPVTLLEGVRATLSVPSNMRGRVGLVFSLPAQDRVERWGMRGADTAVRFTACSRGEKSGRTGWPGGLIVDRPRCVALAVKVAGRPSVRRRVPLGRRC